MMSPSPLGGSRPTGRDASGSGGDGDLREVLVDDATRAPSAGSRTSAHPLPDRPSAVEVAPLLGGAAGSHQQLLSAGQRPLPGSRAGQRGPAASVDDEPDYTERTALLGGGGGGQGRSDDAMPAPSADHTPGAANTKAVNPAAGTTAFGLPARDDAAVAALLRQRPPAGAANASSHGQRRTPFEVAAAASAVAGTWAWRPEPGEAPPRPGLTVSCCADADAGARCSVCVCVSHGGACLHTVCEHTHISLHP